MNESIATKVMNSRRKEKKQVKFTDPLVTETWMIHCPKLSFYQRKLLFYSDHDIQRFRYYEYLRLNPNKTYNLRLSNILMFSTVCLQSLSFLYEKIFSPIISHLKDIRELLVGGKTRFFDHIYYENNFKPSNTIGESKQDVYSFV